MTGEIQRDLALAAAAAARAVGFTVLRDGYVCAPSVGQSLKEMLYQFYLRAQQDLLEDDGR